MRKVFLTVVGTLAVGWPSPLSAQERGPDFEEPSVEEPSLEDERR